MNTMYNIYNKVKIGALAMLMASATLVGCDKLDEIPDNRTDIDTPEKVGQLLTSGYPYAFPALLLEFSSDNVIDNNTVVPSTHVSPYNLWHEEAYLWKNVQNYAQGDIDSPSAVWQAYYQGIAVCNHAIEAMERMSSDPANDADLKAPWGEAHVLRAYLHFVLNNIFAETYLDDARNTVNMGVAYVTKPETTVFVDYGTSEYRHNIKETYDLIEKDLLEGLPLIDDNKYAVPAYHFSKNAANAFAARFYLYKRDYEKVLQYSDAVLGTSASSLLRNWSAVSSLTSDAFFNDWDSENAQCNFLLQSTYSVFSYVFYMSVRYDINDGGEVVVDGKRVTIPSTMKPALAGDGPVWERILPAYLPHVLVMSTSGGSQYGGFFRSVSPQYFEYTDKIAGIGYPHMIYHPFTAEETLLCRAEAKLYLGDRKGAIEDLNDWCVSKQCKEDLTQMNINSFYNRAEANEFVSDLHPAEIGFQKVFLSSAYQAPKDEKEMTDDEKKQETLKKTEMQENQAVLDCILHFRRLETVHTGERWNDVKRYGITVTHYSRKPNEENITVDSLTWDDHRRVLQVPAAVIQAGYPDNRIQPIQKLAKPVSKYDIAPYSIRK